MSNISLIQILAVGFVFFISLEVVKTTQISTKVVTNRHDHDLTSSNYQHVYRDRPNSSLITMSTQEEEEEESQGKSKEESVNPFSKNEMMKKKEEDDDQQVDNKVKGTHVTRRKKRSTTMDTIEAFKEAQHPPDPDEEFQEEDEEQNDEVLGENYEHHPMEQLYEIKNGQEKRKGRTAEGFLGMRGKKESSSKGFVGMRGKKGGGGGGDAFYGMRGKKDEMDKRDAFYGMRGRRGQDADENRLETRNLKDGFLGMRGKKLMELKRRIQGAFVGMRGKKAETDGKNMDTITTTDQGSVNPDNRHVRDVSAFLRQWANQLRRRRMSFDDRLKQVDNIFIGMRG